MSDPSNTSGSGNVDDAIVAKLLDDDALREALTDADDACRAAAVEVLGRRSSDVRRLAAFFDDAPLEKALKCAARRLARSSAALELGELACSALRDASTEANASSVLEGLSDGPHAVELVKRCRSHLLEALRTSRWDRRRRRQHRRGRGDPIHDRAQAPERRPGRRRDVASRIDVLEAAVPSSLFVARGAREAAPHRHQMGGRLWNGLASSVPVGSDI